MHVKKLIPVVLASALLVGCSSESDEVIKVEHELGKPITLETIIDEDASKAKIVSCDETLERYLDLDDEDEFLPIGIYKITVKNNHKKTDYKVKVVDTEKPEWKKFTKKVVCKKGKKIYNWGVYFKAKDMSGEVSVEVNDDKVDYDTVGTYPIEVVAKDSSDNEIKKKSQVEITEADVKDPEDTDKDYDDVDTDYTPEADVEEDVTTPEDTPSQNDTPAQPGQFKTSEDAQKYAQANMDSVRKSNGWSRIGYTIQQSNGYYTVNFYEVKKEDTEAE